MRPASSSLHPCALADTVLTPSKLRWSLQLHACAPTGEATRPPNKHTHHPPHTHEPTQAAPRCWPTRASASSATSRCSPPAARASRSWRPSTRQRSASPRGSVRRRALRAATCLLRPAPLPALHACMLAVLPLLVIVLTLHTCELHDTPPGGSILSSLGSFHQYVHDHSATLITRTPRHTLHPQAAPSCRLWAPSTRCG